MPIVQSTSTAYAVAVSAILLTLVVRVAAGELLGPTQALLLFGVPIAAAAWLGGLKPGLLATVLGGLAGVYFLYEPLDASHLAVVADQARIVVFVGLGLAVSYLAETLHSYRREHELAAKARALGAQWEAVLSGIPSPLFVLDDQWRFTFVSNRLVELVGVGRNQLIGSSVWKAFPAAAGTRFEAKLREAVARQTTVTFEYYHAPWGRWLENHIYPSTSGVAVLVADVTERKQAEDALRQSEERFRSLVANAPVAIFVKDLEGRYIAANPQVRESMGRPDQITGLTDHDLLPAEVADELRRHDLEVISSGRAIEREEVVSGPHGDQFFLAVKFPLIGQDAKPVGVCGVALDVTERKAAEEAQSLLAAIVESSDDAIISKSLDGTILSWNARAERLFGYSAREAIGSPITIIVPSDRHDEEAELLGRIRRGERIEHFETVRVSKRGRLIDVSLTISLVRDGAGRIVGTSSIMQNITERKQAEESLRQSEAQFHMLADSIPQLAWMARPDGHVFWYNQRWYEYTGTTPDQMQRQGWQALVDHAERSRVREKWCEALAGEQPWEDAFPLRRDDGTFRWHLSRALPLRDERGHLVRWFGTHTDIAEQRQMEKALRDADRRKDEFLATLAHELRNPLAPIRSSLQILRLSASADPTVERVEEVMERQVDHLVRLVDDLLDVSRITRGKIELRTERVDVATIVRNAVEVSRPAIDAGHQQLAISLPPEPIELEADAVRLAQVLSNLLNNAAKFTPENGQIWLTARKEAEELALSVRDSGPGIPSEMLPRVFDLFTQGDHAPGKAHGGLGIGLTLVRSLAELHGGTAEARSDGPGKGSEFIVRLPLTQPATRQPSDERLEPSTEQLERPPLKREVTAHHNIAAEVAKPAPPEQADEGTPPPYALSQPILVVDDYHDAASALSMLLKALGIEAHVAHSGEDALAALEKIRPSVVLLDIGMPGMDGYEVARRIRAQPALQAVTLVALTGWGQEQDLRRSREAGFDHHLLKPVDVRAVEELLREIAANTSHRG